MSRANRKTHGPNARPERNQAGTKIIRRTLARSSGTVFSKKTRRALDGTLR